MLFVTSSSIQWPGVSPSTLAPRHSSVFGGHKAVVRPDPIPNSAVKHSLADGSGFIDSARVGRRQFFKKAETPSVSAFYLVWFPVRLAANLATDLFPALDQRSEVFASHFLIRDPPAMFVVRRL